MLQRTMISELRNKVGKVVKIQGPHPLASITELNYFRKDIRYFHNISICFDEYRYFLIFFHILAYNFQQVDPKYRLSLLENSLIQTSSESKNDLWRSFAIESCREN
jgi:hypothetical protein